MANDTAIVTRDATGTGTIQSAAPPALLAMADLAELSTLRQQFAQFVRAQLTAGVHYGVIPGTAKPTLLQPGAQEVVRLYICRSTYDVHVLAEDLETARFAYRVTCRILDGSGVERAQGLGTCSSYESRYRWRQGQRVCPRCQAAAIIRGKEEFGGGWLCWQKRDGCGAKFALADAAITSQSVERVENPDLCDAQNTVLKMACKRALVAAAINLGCCSEYFTQDLDDATEPADAVSPPPPAQPAPVQRPPAPSEPVYISAAQNRRLWAIAKEMAEQIGIDAEALLRDVLAHRGITTAQEILARDYDAIVLAVRSYEPAETEVERGG